MKQKTAGAILPLGEFDCLVLWQRWYIWVGIWSLSHHLQPQI